MRLGDVVVSAVVETKVVRGSVVVVTRVIEPTMLIVPAGMVIDVSGGIVLVAHVELKSEFSATNGPGLL